MKSRLFEQTVLFVSCVMFSTGMIGGVLYCVHLLFHTKW